MGRMMKKMITITKMKTRSMLLLLTITTMTTMM